MIKPNPLMIKNYHLDCPPSTDHMILKQPLWEKVQFSYYNGRFSPFQPPFFKNVTLHADLLPLFDSFSLLAGDFQDKLNIFGLFRTPFFLGGWKKFRYFELYLPARL